MTAVDAATMVPNAAPVEAGAAVKPRHADDGWLVIWLAVGAVVLIVVAIWVYVGIQMANPLPATKPTIIKLDTSS